MDSTAVRSFDEEAKDPGLIPMEPEDFIASIYLTSLFFGVTYRNYQNN
jgi:hypothetical protein